MSNIDTAIYTSDEQLFTELTPEEGAVIEGGATLHLSKLWVSKAVADSGPGNGDDMYFKVNGVVLMPPGIVPDVDDGEVININRTINFNETATVQFFDSDPLGNPDDYLGGFTVGSTPTNGKQWKQISGSGSKYRVSYQVTA